MDYINTLLQNTQYVAYFFCGLILLISLLLIVTVSLNWRINHLQQRYRQMMQGMEGSTIEQMLLTHIDAVNAATTEVDRMRVETDRLKAQLQTCIQRVGMVRFNAFDDTGSDLSFSLALLDERGNGLVVSSLYGRNESRIYAKPVLNRQSTYALSAEEQKAIRIASEPAAAVSQISGGLSA